MNDILKKIDDYTSPTVNTLADTNTRLFREIDKMEKIVRTVPDQRMRENLMSNLDRARMFLLDNMDIFNERMEEQ
jgi:hypothetical protein